MTWIAPMENWFTLYIDKFFKYNVMTNFKSVMEIEMRYIPKNLIDDMSTLVQLMAWCSQATSPYMIQCRPHLWCHMAKLNELSEPRTHQFEINHSITHSLVSWHLYIKSGCRGQWVNSLQPSGTIWWHKSGSTLAQVMACCLTAPRHHLNQSGLIISKVLSHSPDNSLPEDL